METCIELRVRARAETVFALAADVERWPRVLPHYRSVRVLERTSEPERLVAMAAWRQWMGPVRGPLTWTSLQRLRPDEGVIEFHHVKGISRGMQVEWRIEADGEACRVRLHHLFAPAWPVPEGVIQT